MPTNDTESEIEIISIDSKEDSDDEGGDSDDEVNAVVDAKHPRLLLVRLGSAVHRQGGQAGGAGSGISGCPASWVVGAPVELAAGPRAV